MCDVYRSQSRFVIVIVSQSRSIRLILYSFRIQIGSGAGAKLPPPRCKKSNIFGWGVFSCKRSSIEEFSTRATSWPVFSVQNPMLKVVYSIPLKRNGLSSKKCCQWFRITYNFHPVFINCINFAKIAMALSNQAFFHTNAGHVPTSIRENAAYAYLFHLFSFFYTTLPERQH